MNKWLIQSLIVVPAIVGTLCLSVSSNYWEIVGWVLYIISDIFGITFFVKNKMWLMVSQYAIFTMIAINGIFQRLV